MRRDAVAGRCRGLHSPTHLLVARPLLLLTSVSCGPALDRTQCAATPSNTAEDGSAHALATLSALW